MARKRNVEATFNRFGWIPRAWKALLRRPRAGL